MANPYKDAERKRQEEAERKRKEAEAKEAAQKPQEMPKQEERVTTPAEPEKPAQTKEEAVTTDLLADLDIEKSANKTFSFYLGIENVKKLEKLAKKKGVSSSKLLDHIISKL